MDKETIIEFFNNFAPHWDNEPICEKPILDIILDNGGIMENINVLDVAEISTIIIIDRKPYFFIKTIGL